MKGVGQRGLDAMFPNLKDAMFPNLKMERPCVTAIISDMMTVNRYYGLEERMTEIEQKLRRDPRSFIPLPGR